MLSVPWTFLFFSFPSFITTFSSRSQIWQPYRGACWSLCGLLPFSASQMTPNAYSVRLKGCCLMAVLSLPPHLQLALGTWKDAFPIRCNDRQVGGRRQANNSGYRGTENRDQVLDKVLALLNKRKTRIDIDSVPLFVCHGTVAGRRHLGSLVTQATLGKDS